MAIKVKIYGAGSIGNHLAQASRRNDWDVSVVDPSQQALERMKENIYPARYGAWDNNITLYKASQEPIGGFDVVMIGTPPDVRMDLALKVAEEDRPRLIALEKPLCAIKDLSKYEELQNKLSRHNIVALVGYNHALADSVKKITELLRSEIVGDIQTIVVEFLAHWGDIFAAHPWLAGPEDTYLGNTLRGGGAIGEHSHGIQLWLYLAQVAGFGRLAEVSAFLDFDGGKIQYDKIAALNLCTDKSRHGRVVQDVVTKPTRKWARVQGSKGFIEWNCESSYDSVHFEIYGGKSRKIDFPKTRPDEFFVEILHIEEILAGKISPSDSPISLDIGLRTMQVIEAAYNSSLARRAIRL